MGSPCTQKFIHLSTITFFIFAFSFPANSQINNNNNQTAYEIVSSYDFPIGILPKGVTGYELDESTGKFSAYLNGPCSFSLEGSYQLSYKSTIGGFISRGKLTGLEGVKVKLLFVWVDIVEVSRSGEDLKFSVGIASAGFPMDNFEECPQCGCGLNCANGEIGEVGRNPIGVSSF
ncbi:uncharacterized protein At5g01610-like [Actinidia eriantha]|uniref:uncharacterized protein At5g01610-like n=1 Tax=Actinidia eriantha TaxID=165200 RepID=UPI00258EC0A9|nr:uncharacterized protein At5g01610-like [Actinidia eriantha]